MNAMGGVGNSRGKPKGQQFGRSDRSPIGRWFWEIDKVLLILVAVLISIGLIAVAAASPAAPTVCRAAASLSAALFLLSPAHVDRRRVPVMIAGLDAPQGDARRFCLFGAILFTVLLFLVPIVGQEINGAQRWLGVGFHPVPAVRIPEADVRGQPRLAAFAARSGQQPARRAAVRHLHRPGCAAADAAAQFRRDHHLRRGLGDAADAGGRADALPDHPGRLRLGGVVAAYFLYDVATVRIDAFLFGASGDVDTYQTDSAMRTLTAGGLFGAGPGGGVHKFRLPEPQTDYIFSVIGEEFGLIACLAIALIYMTIIARVLVKLLHEEDRFLVLATAGLVGQFGLQAVINMCVNVQLAPSKGMTLPFISYGGSSMVALSIGFGLLLAFTRRNPYLHRSPYVVKWSAR
jgi:cell division protein FtsW